MAGKDSSKSGCRMPVQLPLAIICFFGMQVFYMTRVNLSVAIVAMAGPEKNDSEQTKACHEAGEDQESVECVQLANPDEFSWDEQQQGAILGSFAYGYILTQLIGGRLAEMYGARRVLGCSMTITSLLTIVTPFAARLHTVCLIIVRVCIGLAQGTVFPALQILLTRWIPIKQRARYMGFIVEGVSLGVVVTLPMCGALTAGWGWPFAFYITGGLSLFWCCCWFLVAYDAPSQHPRLSPEVAERLEAKLRETGTSKETPPLPWRQLLLCRHTWAPVVAEFGVAWGATLCYTMLPTYMRYVMHFDLVGTGFISAVPFLCRWLGGLIWPSIAALLARRQILSLISGRRLFSSIALLIPAVAFAFLPAVVTNATYTVLLLCISMFCVAAQSSGHLLNMTELSPNYAGTISGLANGVGNMAGFIAPITVGAFTLNQQVASQWQKVFWVSAGVCAICQFLFLMLVSVTVQPWNYGLVILRFQMFRTSNTFL